MNLKIKFSIIVLFVIVGSTSCKKFLNQEPKYLLTPSGAVTDEKSAQSILNGAYSFIGKDEWTVRFSGGFSSMVGVVNYNNSAYRFDMNATGDNNILWPAFYKTVNGANAALAAISDLPESVFRNPARKQEMLAEARTIRAFANMYIFYYFGRWWDEPTSEYGILFNDQVSDLTNIFRPRLSVGESYKIILEDLDFAIEKAPDYKNGRRASKQLARALKAKVLLNRGKGTDYKDALDLVTKVIDESTAVGIKLEPSLTSLYDKSWDSNELLFCRFRETTDDIVSAYNYTYGYNYATLLITDLGKAYLEGDPRYNEAWGMILSPIPNNNNSVWACKKLARKGRKAGTDNDKYTTYFLRLTELYLMKAELLQRTGAPLTSAIENINIIRRRSNLADTTVSSVNDFNQLLFRELFIELHMENEADWMASLRIKDESGKRLIYSLRGPGIEVIEDRFIYPIPTVEMKFNHLMKQNPSYENLVY